MIKRLRLLYWSYLQPWRLILCPPKRLLFTILLIYPRFLLLILLAMILRRLDPNILFPFFIFLLWNKSSLGFLLKIRELSFSLGFVRTFSPIRVNLIRLVLVFEGAIIELGTLFSFKVFRASRGWRLWMGTAWVLTLLERSSSYIGLIVVLVATSFLIRTTNTTFVSVERLKGSWTRDTRHIEKYLWCYLSIPLP